MEPTLPKLDSFDYLGGTPGQLSMGYKIGIGVLVFFALLSLLALSLFWLLVFGGGAYLAYRKGKKKTILIGPRYLICANEIVYFHNVQQAELQENEGKLTLRLPEDKTFTLDHRLMATRRNLLADSLRAPGKQRMLFRKLSAKIIKGMKSADQEVQRVKAVKTVKTVKAVKAQPAAQKTLPG